MLPHERQITLGTAMPLYKSMKLKISFLISQSKHMFWPLKKPVSMRHLF